MIRWFVNYETFGCTGVTNKCTIEWLLKHNFKEVDKAEYDRIKAIVDAINTLKFELGIDINYKKCHNKD